MATEPQSDFVLALAGAEAAERLGQLHEAGQYWIWAQRQEITAPRILLLERRAEGVVAYDRPGYFMHVVPAGVPHHLAHVFGYWLTTDADRIWVQIEQPEQMLYVLIVGGQSDVHRQHQLTWLCAHCGATLVEREIRLERPTVAKFLAAERAAVQSVNAELAARRCPSCGFVHPPAYGLDPASDTPEERDARATW